MAKIIAGSKVTVLVWQTPPGAEMLGMEGKQVWYGDGEGLGSTTAQDVSDCFVVGELKFASSEGEAAVADNG